MNISVIPHNIGCNPSPSCPAETLLQDGDKTYLLFFAVSNSVDETGYLKDLGVAILLCKDCLISKFGYPNDEGRPEHPLYKYGLAKFPISEIVDSLWTKEVLEQINNSAHRIKSGYFSEEQLVEDSKKRHFIITLKTATFECIASSLVVEHFCETFDDAFNFVISKLNEN
jgi:hypothetical protein